MRMQPLMDEIVRQAMAKWPNVLCVYGWLGLDRRGKWLIKGDRIANPAVADFISRNYEHDAGGCWFFQNGPQRVFVALEYTPFIYRMTWDDDDPAAAPLLTTHTGKHVAAVSGAWLDEAGILLLTTEHGIGMVDDRDLERLVPYFAGARGQALDEDTLAAAIERVQTGRNANLHFRYREQAVPVAAVASNDVPDKFGFVRQPVQPNGQEECH